MNNVPAQGQWPTCPYGCPVCAAIQTGAVKPLVIEFGVQPLTPRRPDHARMMTCIAGGLLASVLVSLTLEWIGVSAGWRLVAALTSAVAAMFLIALTIDHLEGRRRLWKRADGR